jgi:LPXTG-motif cell wall-anchored protein
MIFSGILVMGFATPALAAPCDAYSGVCPSTAPTESPLPFSDESPLPFSDNPGGPALAPSPSVCACDTPTGALPFTGAELVLMTAIGGAALAGGTALVVAGRRRRTAG